MIDYETLVALTSPEAIAEARDAMDLETISRFHYDARGKLEAAVKPAPPSTEKPAYVRIAFRGKRVRIACNVHPGNQWCIHAIILVLHHLGKAPDFVAKRPPTNTAPKPGSGPKIGFQWRIRFQVDGAEFRIFSHALGRGLTNPLRQLTEGHGDIAIQERTRELIKDVADEDTQSFHVPRQELAPVLQALQEDVKLYDDRGEILNVETTTDPPPMLEVAIKPPHLRFSRRHLPFKRPFIAPGWKGYLAEKNKVLAYSDYVPDLTRFLGDTHQAPLKAGLVRTLLTQKHGVRWAGAKPQWLRLPEGTGLQVDFEHGELRGRMGIWHEDAFLPLRNLTDPDQLVQNGDQWYLISLNAGQLSQLDKDRAMMRLPWRDAGFQIRGSQAAETLDGLKPPRHWRVDREAADRKLGIKPLALTVTWDGMLPTYMIDGERFEHAEVAAAAAGRPDRLALLDGRLLNVDTREILRNEGMLQGVQSLHDTPERQQHLLDRLLGDQDEEPPPELPERWRSLLRDYQEMGVSWLLQRHQYEEPALLADDMGLGKTIQTLVFLQIIREDLPQLVIVPTSLLRNWQTEARKFTPDRKVLIHHGPNRTKNAAVLTKADLVITSYGTARRDADMLYDVEFQTVVLDEAQAIKNPKSQTAQAVCELWRRGAVALSGTPVENRLEELFSIFHFLAPGYLGEEDDIKSIHDPGSPIFAALRHKVRPFLKRRLKSEVARDLPPKTETTVVVPLTDIQRQLYDQLRRDAFTTLREGGAKATLSVLTKILRLRQVCCHAGLIDDTLTQAPSAKFDYLLDQVDALTKGGHAALVFSQFTSLLKRFAFELEERDQDFLYLDGATKNRQDLVDQFQAGAAPIFLISLKAGGTGLNLTRAGYVYHLDPWWNPMVEAQATDRAHRIGQTQEVFSYKLIAENTIEERILSMQANKKALAEALWTEDAQKLDHKMLLELLEN